MQSAGRSHIYGSHDHGKLVTAIEQQAAEVVEILSEDEILPKDRSGGRGAACRHRLGWKLGVDLSNKHRPRSLPVFLR